MSGANVRNQESCDFWSAFTQTGDTNKLSHKLKWNEQHTIYVENPVFREKPREQNISLWEKTKYNHGMIKPDLVWACTETTIWPERIKPQHVDIYPPLKLPKLLCFLLYSSVLHTSFFLSHSFWVISLTQSLLCFSLSRSLCYASL